MENKDNKTEKAEAREQKKLQKRAERAAKRREFRRRQSSASIYFLLWAAFSAISLIIVLLFGFAQRMVMIQTYEGTIARRLHDEGKEIQEAIIDRPPEEFNGSWSAYLNFLSGYYGVDVYIISPEGEVVFPRNPGTESENGRGQRDFSKEVEKLIAELEAQNSGFVIYDGDGEYVYGAEVHLYGDSPLYLYVAQPLDLLQTVSNQMTVRIALIAVFVFILSFAVSSAISGWLTKPISEMTKKAHQLAGGDFDVDFHGSQYGTELIELADSLNYARDELSKADKMQKELIANVSHDFKTPLTMIKAYASMIQEISGEIAEKRNKHAQVIVDEADRLTSLVNDLLDLSKIRSGLSELQTGTIDMSAYTQELLERFAYLRETQGYRFIVEIEDGLYALADKVKIGQALYNLIGNAVNYTGEDKTVYVSLKRTGEDVFRFAVRDTGAGIKNEELATIWDRYYRSTETHKRPVKGTGLGLSIVKVVLERHGLHFGVESEQGKGSVFFVDFPLEKEAE